MTEQVTRSILLDVTLKEIRGHVARTGSLAELARDANVPYGWLHGLVEGKYKDPSVNRIEHLYEFLTNRKLEV